MLDSHEGALLTDGHQEVLQVPRHLALDALLQRLLADVLVLNQSCQRQDYYSCYYYDNNMFFMAPCWLAITQLNKYN